MKRIIIYGLKLEFRSFVAAIQGWHVQRSLVEFENLLTGQEALAKQMGNVTVRSEEEALYAEKVKGRPSPSHNRTTNKTPRRARDAILKRMVKKVKRVNNPVRSKEHNVTTESIRLSVTTAVIVGMSHETVERLQRKRAMLPPLKKKHYGMLKPTLHRL